MPPKKSNKKEKFPMPEIKGKTLSPTSVRIYQGRLTHLIDSGFKNIDDLLEYPDEIIEFIKTMSDNGAKSDKEKEAELLEQRVWMSAIDYVLFDTPADKKKKYTDYYATLWLKPGDKYGNGQIWLSKEEWAAKKAAKIAELNLNVV